MYLYLLPYDQRIDFLFVIVVSAVSISENESLMRNFSPGDNPTDEDLIIPESFDLYILCVWN